jgi:hypothetical protein
MRFVHLVIAAAVSAVAIACTSSVTDPSSSDSPQAHGGPCEASAEGEGVKITIRSASCDYDRGAHATFEYEITTTDALAPITVAAGTSCGSCRKYSTQIAPWASWRIGGTSKDGTGVVYCLCDTGCCAPDTGGTYDVAPATFEDTIEWSGRSWAGPSDTGEKEGAFFPPGRYDVEVSFASAATAKLSIVIRDESD